MTSHVIQIELEPGGPAIVAELRGDELKCGEAFSPAADPRELLNRGGRSVREAVDEVVVPTARVMMQALERLAPTSIEIELGLKLSGQFGMVIASSEAEGSIAVKLTWDRSTLAEMHRADVGEPK